MTPTRAPAESLAALLRLWPWRTSLAAAALIVLVVGAARQWDFAGIEGFSTTNYGWLAFSLVGGVGLAWRLARPAGGWQIPLRPVAAACLAFAVCFVAVTLMGLVFIPGQSVGETVTTDAPGRAVWVAVFVAAAGYGSELLAGLRRLLRR